MDEKIAQTIINILKSQRDSATAQVQDLLIELQLMRGQIDDLKAKLSETQPSSEGFIEGEI